jgi:hypothetical protein
MSNITRNPFVNAMAVHIMISFAAVFSGRLKTTIYCAFVLLLMVALAAFAFKTTSANISNAVRGNEVIKRASNPYNQLLVDSGIRMLRTGDLVVRMGADMTSYMFSQINQTDKSYSHCGLVVVENGKPYIYHSIGGEDNPDQILKKDSAAFWFSPSNNLGFGIVRYSIDKAAIDSLTSVVLGMYNEKRKFDMDFDLKTDDRLYCAEFVYKALNQVVNDSEYIKPVTVLGYTFVGVDNLFLHEQAKLICQLRFK